ncbi:hypothetical protein DL93DRAFT_2090297 [Clavulina sp. PMI_390]|nr:hypothetical protein DL93DRAFT_2090297 [Clavulina sp. PMI_390]
MSSQNGNASLRCYCDLPASHFETKKPGINQGRWFFKCGRPIGHESACRYFQWEDELPGHGQGAPTGSQSTIPPTPPSSQPGYPASQPSASSSFTTIPSTPTSNRIMGRHNSGNLATPGSTPRRMRTQAEEAARLAKIEGTSMRDDQPPTSPVKREQIDIQHPFASQSNDKGKGKARENYVEDYEDGVDLPPWPVPVSSTPTMVQSTPSSSNTRGTKRSRLEDDDDDDEGRMRPIPAPNFAFRSQSTASTIASFTTARSASSGSGTPGAGSRIETAERRIEALERRIVELETSRETQANIIERQAEILARNETVMAELEQASRVLKGRLTRAETHCAEMEAKLEVHNEALFHSS